MENGRAGDLVIPQGAYAFVQDGANGQVDVIVGPYKLSLAETDKTVRYNSRNRTYDRVNNTDSITPVMTANEGEYLVLNNPAKSNKHPDSRGKVQAEQLEIGKKLNISGPAAFALFPGQTCEVVPGHQLKFNEYLIVRVYDEETAKANWGQVKACLKVANGSEAGADSKVVYAEVDKVQLGVLYIVRGVDTSFFIPPTGVEVLKDENGNYVRQAVTLETLEYCILLDQNGEKRYVQGPEVVFPNPTETFVTKGAQKKYNAVELNENMALFVKVIADYKEGDKQYKSGDELFITGKEQKIYYPRAEHAIVKYGDQVIHYAIALPEGEGRYMLNKDDGSVNIVRGPKMLLPDPRREVIVKRVLNSKTVELWFPGNNEAKEFNAKLEQQLLDSGQEMYQASYSNSIRSFAGGGDKLLKSRSALYEAQADTMERGTSYTKPRTITLDNKYEGVVMINIWPGYAVQVVSKDGKRKVESGPKILMLEYDETLEILELSTGKPKTDNSLLRTVYLQTQNNIVSDLIEATTADQVKVSIRLSYRVNFTADQETKWFSVSNYVKLMTQHLRSVVRNVIKKETIANFNTNSTDIIRDTVLGKQVDGKRPGKQFDENGMFVYDVEVLDVQILDSLVGKLLLETQHEVVENLLKLTQKESNTNYAVKAAELDRKVIDAQEDTNKKKADNVLAEIARRIEAEEKQLELAKKEESRNNEIHNSKLSRTKSAQEQETLYNTAAAEIRIKEAKEKLAAITPGLIEAVITAGNVGFLDSLAKNVKSQQGGLASLFGGTSGFDGLLELVKGTPLEDKAKDLIASYKKQQETRRGTTVS